MCLDVLAQHVRKEVGHTLKEELLLTHSVAKGMSQFTEALVLRSLASVPSLLSALRLAGALPGPGG